MKDLYADIIVDISQEKLDKTFQYLVPKELASRIEEGKKVRIPFGNGGRELTGYVVGLSSEPKIEPGRIKPILAVEEQGMEIESRLISLAAWIARNYWLYYEPGPENSPSCKRKGGRQRAENISA